MYAIRSYYELFIIGKFGKGNRTIAQFVIDLHHGQTGGQAKDFGIGIFGTGKFECFLFNLARQSSPAVIFHDNQA